MKTIAFVIFLAVAVLLLPLFFKTPAPAGESRSDDQLPWAVVVTDDGNSRALGLSLGQSPLNEAIRVFGVAPTIAILGRREEAGSLEAFFDGVRLGPLTGKIVVSLELTRETLDVMRSRAVKSDYMESATLRSTLDPADREQAMRLPVRAIVFVPSARLDDEVITARFGLPGERLTTADGVRHYLYAERGLAIALDEAGKAMLQYVSPRQFALLREPLIRPTLPATAGASTGANSGKHD